MPAAGPDFTQRPCDRWPHNCTRHGGFRLVTTKQSPQCILDSGTDTPIQQRCVIDYWPKATPRRSKRANQPIFSFISSQARGNFLRKIVLGLKRKELKNTPLSSYDEYTKYRKHIPGKGSPVLETLGVGREVSAPER